MKSLLLAPLLVLTACSHTYNDRGLSAPPRHPFKFGSPPPPVEPAVDPEPLPHPRTKPGQPIIDTPDPKAPPYRT